jgi:hypothetical protein
MLIVSTGFKIAILGPSSFLEIFNGGQIRVFAGSRPSNPNFAEPSLPIGTINRVLEPSTGLQFLQDNDYILSPPADPWALTVLEPGTAAWFRLVAAGDTYADSQTAPRIDGDIGTAANPNDMVLNVTTFTPNTVLSFSSFLYTIPPLITP